VPRIYYYDKFKICREFIIMINVNSNVELMLYYFEPKSAPEYSILNVLKRKLILAYGPTGGRICRRKRRKFYSGSLY
jgi:hypothetical protein